MHVFLFLEASRHKSACPPLAKPLGDGSLSMVYPRIMAEITATGGGNLSK